MKPAAKKEEMKITKSDVVKPDVQVTDLAITDAPSYLAEYATERPEGFEEVRPSDVKVPRVALAQSLSPQLNEDQPEFIHGLRKGEYFNTIGKAYGAKILFVPLLKFANRRLFLDMDQGGGILCRSDDMKHGEGEPGGDCITCELAKFGSARGGDGKGTACTEFFNFPVLIVEDGKLDAENIAIFSMKSSHIDAAKHLIGLTMRRKIGASRAPMWAGIYSATSKLKKFTEKLSAYVPIIDNAGWVGQEDAKLARSAYEFMHQLREQGRLATDEVDEPGASDASNQ